MSITVMPLSPSITSTSSCCVLMYAHLVICIFVFSHGDDALSQSQAPADTIGLHTLSSSKRLDLQSD